HAHERGLTHRDIKPSNLLRTADGKTVKLLDLGLARQEAPAGEQTSSDSTLTESGAVVGTPDYIAPEQSLHSHQADVRSAIYSLGGTLYYLLTGKPPYAGGTATEKLLRHHVEPPPSVARALPGVPEALDAVVARMLAKSPADRYQEPLEVADAL